MYLMESEREAGRLEAKTDAAAVHKRLLVTDLQPGMRVLDAGAGSGAVARVMCEIVTESGLVCALDRSVSRSAFAKTRAHGEAWTHLHVVAGDVYHAPLKSRAFDFVWAEFLLEYLTDPDRAVAALCSLVRPGGKLVLAELDGHGLFHYPLRDEIARGLDVLSAALRGRFDPFAGRKLFHRMYRAGLHDIKVHMLPYHFYPGRTPETVVAQWRLKFDILRDHSALAFGGVDVYERWAGMFLDMLRDPAVFTYAVLFLVEGRTPML